MWAGSCLPACHGADQPRLRHLTETPRVNTLAYDLEACPEGSTPRVEAPCSLGRQHGRRLLCQTPLCAALGACGRAASHSRRRSLVLSSALLLRGMRHFQPHSVPLERSFQVPLSWSAAPPTRLRLPVLFAFSTISVTEDGQPVLVFIVGGKAAVCGLLSDHDAAQAPLSQLTEHLRTC